MRKINLCYFLFVGVLVSCTNTYDVCEMQRNETEDRFSHSIYAKSANLDLDEPTSGLDPLMQLKFVELMKQFKQQRNWKKHWKTRFQP